MRYLESESFPTNPNIWMRSAEKAAKYTYCEYILIYTNHDIVVFKKLKHILKEKLSKEFELKLNLLSPPNIYLDVRLYWIMVYN